MTSQNEPKPYAIVVGVDYSELGDLALERACEIARPIAAAQLHVVHVEAAAEASSHDIQEAAPANDLGKASTKLHKHVEEVVQRWCKANGVELPFTRVTTHVRSEHAAEAIAQLASDVEAELVVVGTHGRRGAKRFILGSVAEGTVRLAPCAVLVVRQADASIPKIAPPCPECLETRRATNGSEFWCEQHRGLHGRRHTYHYGGGQGTRQSGFLIHTR